MHLSLLILYQILFYVNISEDIDQKVANTFVKQVQCRQASCNINCIADKSCTTSFSHDPTAAFEIHCPSGDTCTQCDIHCYGKHSCQNSSIYIYQCSSVNIIATKSYSLHGATVITDKISGNDTYNGHLSIYNNAVYLSSDNTIKTNIMSYLHIENEYIANVSIYCYGNSIYSKHECNHISMSNNIHSTHISLTCHNNADCSSSEILCPIDRVYHNNNEYESHCTLHCNASSNCNDISIYAKRGIPSDFWYECDDHNNVTCFNSTVYCGQQYESQCDIMYNKSVSEWVCNGYNDDESCVDMELIYTIRNPVVKISSFWTKTSYGIPMSIFVIVVMLCLVVALVQIIRQKCRDNRREMLQYEIEDAMELEQRNKFKLWLQSMFGKFANTSRNDIDDTQTVQRRIELENLKQMTRFEMYDSDDELGFDGMETGDNDNGTLGYGYPNTVALPDL